MFIVISTGYYIFIEASSGSGRQPNDTARLASPSGTMFSGGPACVQWWYHMYGTNIGRLALFLSSQTTNGKDVSILPHNHRRLLVKEADILSVQ